MRGKIVQRTSRIFSEAEVMTRLEPHLPFLTSLPHLAVERYLKQVAPAFSSRWPRERASVIHALMIEAMTARYAADMIRAGGRWLWRVTNDLLVQFKKLGSSGLPRNYPTPRALGFDAQLDLIDVPAGMRVTLGYTLDEETSEVVSVRVVGQQGRQILFSSEPVVVQPVLPLFAAASAAKTTTRRRLRAKRDVSASTPKKQTGGEGEET
jgi:hypothetical protein